MIVGAARGPRGPRDYEYDEAFRVDEPGQVRRHLLSALAVANAGDCSPPFCIQPLLRFWGPRGHGEDDLRNLFTQWESVPLGVCVAQDRAFVPCVGVAVAVAPDGTVFARVVGEARPLEVRPGRWDRHQEFGLSEADLFFIEPVALVFKALWAEPPKRTDRDFDARMHRSIRARPTDHELWLILADWREDLSDYAMADKCRQAAVVAKDLQAYGFPGPPKKRKGT